MRTPIKAIPNTPAALAFLKAQKDAAQNGGNAKNQAGNSGNLRDDSDLGSSLSKADLTEAETEFNQALFDLDQ